MLAEAQPASGRTFAPGERLLGKYRVVRELGQGGMGFVYQAHHDELDRPVAIKVLRPEFAHSDLVAERLLREARAAGRIRSEHAVRILDYGKLDDGCPCIVMEYLEGETLAERLQGQGRLALPEIIDFIVQACTALAEAHAVGIVHRDLKPENLFVTNHAGREDSIKVLDFGISKDLDHGQSVQLTHPSLTLGSPEYMSPEQVQTPTDLDARADIWSLGVVLYELSTGRTPFTGATLMQVFASVLQSKIEAPSKFHPDLPDAFDAIVLRCLRRDPRDRFQSVFDLADALQHIGVTSSRPSRVSRLIQKRFTTSDGVAALTFASSATLLSQKRRVRSWILRSAAGVPLVGLVLGSGLALTTSNETALRAESKSVCTACLTETSWMRPLELRIPKVHLENEEHSEPEKVEVATRRAAPSPRAKIAASLDEGSKEKASTETVAPATVASIRPWDPSTFGGRK